MSHYGAFLAKKAIQAPVRGMKNPPRMPGHLFPFQAASVEFGLRTGSWGCFLGTGLGKTRCKATWAAYALEQANGYALILTPLAVARQIEAEARSLGYTAHVIRSQDDAKPGINICNYDRLERLTPEAFGVAALDEGSILKDFSGRTSRALIERFSGHRWRMSASATPAPNDHMELGTQAEFCGILNQAEMLIRWFVNDSFDASKTWRLKGHAVTDFWDWMASWSRMAEHPRDLGDDVAGFDLKPFRTHRHVVEGNVKASGALFAGLEMSATGMHDVKRQTSKARAAKTAELVLADKNPWLVWCDTDYEADALADAFGDAPGVVDVRGSQTPEQKEDSIAAFLDGTARVLVTKPSIAGQGLNMQHCARMVFVGRSFSFETWYQAVRRCWRFGQKETVDVHLIVADGEDAIARVIDRKARDNERMREQMAAAMRRAMGRSSESRVAYDPKHQGRLPRWLASNSVERSIPVASGAGVQH